MILLAQLPFLDADSGGADGWAAEPRAILLMLRLCRRMSRLILDRRGAQPSPDLYQLLENMRRELTVALIRQPTSVAGPAVPVVHLTSAVRSPLRVAQQLQRNGCIVGNDNPSIAIHAPEPAFTRGRSSSVGAGLQSSVPAGSICGLGIAYLAGRRKGAVGSLSKSFRDRRPEGQPILSRRSSTHLTFEFLRSIRKAHRFGQLVHMADSISMPR